MQEFTASANELSNVKKLEDRSDGVIANQIRLKMTFACSFCLGFGHTVKDCATMKKINRITEKGSFAQKIAWGRKKSQAVAARMQEASTMKLVGLRRQSMGLAMKNAHLLGVKVVKMEDNVMSPPANKGKKTQSLIT